LLIIIGVTTYLWTTPIGEIPGRSQWPIVFPFIGALVAIYILGSNKNANMDAKKPLQSVNITISGIYLGVLGFSLCYLAIRFITE
jgi:hypothetical protein